MNASGAAVLNPINKLFEVYLVSKLQRFGALIERDNAVPRVAHKTELEVGLELLVSDFSPALFRAQQIKASQNPIFSSAIARPIGLHLVFDLPQIQMWFPRFAQNGPHAGRPGLGHLNEDAFVFMRDHCPAAKEDRSDGSAGTRTRI